MFYLVAGLWAAHWREGRSEKTITIGKACATLQNDRDSGSIERRFIALLDSDGDQLPHRLRQIISLLNDYNLDFETILNGLLYWKDEQKHTQNAWARDYYRNLDSGPTDTEINIDEEATR
jgi:CRISPR system Cascade subunit CasB